MNNAVIYNDDFLTTELVKPQSIDLIVTSPPYNVELKYSSNIDDMTYDDYLNFSGKWLNKALDLMNDTGRLCLNIPLNHNKNGQQSVSADLIGIAKEFGWSYHSTIIWNKNHIPSRTAWGSWMSASAPSVIAHAEAIVVMYKNRWKKDKGESDITREEFINFTNGIWTFGGQRRSAVGNHPAPFPLELPYRCIKLFSYVGDIVLDPFSGSGTTVLSATRNNRIGIGIDIDKTYCEIAQNRLGITNFIK